MIPPADLAAIRALVEAVKDEHAPCDPRRKAGLTPHPCKVCDLLTILAGYDDADTAEWQRVHGAAAQAARDIAHWRTRAEHAEALCETQMARVTRLEKWLTNIRDFCRGKASLYEPFVRADAALEGRDA